MKMTEYIKCPTCDGLGEYHDETMELGKEKLIECETCKGRQEVVLKMVKIKRLIPKGKVDHVEALRFLLEKAEKGEFDNFVFATKSHDGEIATSWSNTDLQQRNELISHLQMDLIIGTVEQYFEEN
jgi:DnaJ-class molecular chaperone